VTTRRRIIRRQFFNNPVFTRSHAAARRRTENTADYLQQHVSFSGLPRNRQSRGSLLNTENGVGQTRRTTARASE
jgi:hypothetical protein